jgi:hypothetical protein
MLSFPTLLLAPISLPHRPRRVAECIDLGRGLQVFSSISHLQGIFERPSQDGRSWFARIQLQTGSVSILQDANDFIGHDSAGKYAFAPVDS